jgi:hypothetical protein
VIVLVALVACERHRQINDGECKCEESEHVVEATFEHSRADCKIRGRIQDQECEVARVRLLFAHQMMKYRRCKEKEEKYGGKEEC